MKKQKLIIGAVLTIMFYTYFITQNITDVDCNLTRLIYSLFGQAFIALIWFPTQKKKKKK